VDEKPGQKTGRLMGPCFVSTGIERGVRGNATIGLETGARDRGETVGLRVKEDGYRSKTKSVGKERGGDRRTAGYFDPVQKNRRTPQVDVRQEKKENGLKTGTWEKRPETH